MVVRLGSMVMVMMVITVMVVMVIALLHIGQWQWKPQCSVLIHSFLPARFC